MANSYNPNQSWAHRPGFGKAGLQLEHEFEFSLPTGPADRQRLPEQQPSRDYTYQFGHSSLPQSSNMAASSSSLHGAFSAQQHGQQEQHSSNSFGSVASAQSGSHASGAFMHGLYGSNPTQALSQMPSTNGAYHNVPYQYANVQPPLPMSVGTTDNVAAANAPYLSSSPGPMQETFSHPSPTGSQNQASYYPPQPADPLVPQAKRQRSHFSNDPTDEDQDTDMATDQKEGAKVKAPGACARCKNLKVKCEFKTETDPCKRCLNGGHDCVIPGRKKRRTPPKREHLLAQIREQAAQIQKLMAQLESTNSGSARAPSLHTDVSPSLGSPVLSPSSASNSYFDSEGQSVNESPSIHTATPEAHKAVEDWIAKAKESLQEFGGFIGIGGAGMPKSYVVHEDLEESDSSGDDEYVDVQEDLENEGLGNNEYGVFVEDPNGEDSFETGIPGKLNHKSSASSISTTGATSTSGNGRRKNGGESAKTAILPVEASPFGLFGNLSLKTNGQRSRTGSSDQEEDKGPGIANANFFKSTSGPSTLVRSLNNLQHQVPHILARGIITPLEAEKLFQIYFTEMNLSVSLLDPVLYTAQRTFYRSPFLFTVICAIASRFYSERPDLYAHAMHYAQLAAGTALISGTKNVEMCHAYILLSLYPVPARKWEDQRNWLYLGLAIRSATDLNLHLPTTAKPVNENHAREMLNRTRVWLNCFNLDRSTGSQYGKPPIISSADYMANHSRDWWKSSPYNMKHFDIHISAYNSELKVMGRFISKIYSDPEHPTGLNKEVDFEAVATETDDEFKTLWEYWDGVLSQTDMSDPQNSFRTGLLRLAYSYARMVALSYGFQHAFGKNDGMDENPFLLRCLSAASDVVHAVVNNICRPSQLHWWRHGPEAQSVFVTFASAFLVKLLQPKFAAYLTIDQRTEIRGLVQKVVDLLGSPEIAIDDRHGPKLYSKFLRNLLASPMARVDPTSPGASSNASLPRQQRHRPKSASGNTPGQTPEPFDYRGSNRPSPAKSGSLSPPPSQAALSFNNFAPIGAADPYAQELTGASASIHDLNGTSISMSEFFQPELPFDNDIMQSMQSLTDPSGWQDISLPGFNWMPQLSQNLGLDLRNNDGSLYNPNLNYMTGSSQ